MPRPSRNVDEQLLRAGRDLFPETGYAALSVRRVAERAGVNPGMFHYHFRTKDAFVRRLLQQVYDEMFADFEVAAGDGPPVAALRRAVGVIANFAAVHRGLFRRIVIDALAGQPVAIEFLRSNLPRHVGVIVALVAAGQRAGKLRPLPLAQAVSFLAGAVAAPVLLGGALLDSGVAPAEVAVRFEADVLSADAIALRIDLALAALSAGQEAP